MTQELGWTLETRTEDGGIVRTWVEPWGSSLNEEWLDKLADQQMWDYERYGRTDTFVVLPCGDLPLSALRVPDGAEPDDTRGEPGLDDAEMGTIDSGIEDMAREQEAYDSMGTRRAARRAVAPLSLDAVEAVQLRDPLTEHEAVDAAAVFHVLQRDDPYALTRTIEHVLKTRQQGTAAPL